MQLAKRKFNYEQLDSETQMLLKDATSEIRGMASRVSVGIVEIGTALLDAKDRLEHGQFTDWLAAEFDWSEATALRMMRVAKKFKSVNLTDLESIQPSALYMLASNSTPEKVREQFIDQAKSGQPVTHAEVKQALRPLAIEIGEDDAKPKKKTETVIVDESTGEILQDAVIQRTTTTKPDAIQQTLSLSLRHDPHLDAQDIYANFGVDYCKQLCRELGAIIINNGNSLK